MKNIIISIIMFWFIECVAYTHINTATTHAQHKSFNNVTYDIEDKIIFHILKVNETFQDIRKIPLLYQMLRSLKVMSEHNFENYYEIKTALKDDKKVNTTFGELLNLSQEIGEMLNSYLAKGPGTIENIDTANSSVEVNDNTPGFNDSNVYTNDSYKSTETNMLPSLNDVMKNLNNMTLGDIMNWYSYKFHEDVQNMSEIFESSRKLNMESHKWNPLETSVFPVNDNRRIYRGSSTSIKKYSFMASIHVRGVFSCAGSIIGRNYIITAASCFLLSSKGEIKFLSVRVGSDYPDRFGTVLPVIEVMVHPHYDARYLWNNVAIARTRGMKFNKKYGLKWIEYENNTGRVWNTDVYVTILGWGDKDTQSYKQFDAISVSPLKLYNLDTCKYIYTRNFVSNNNFCAGFVKSGHGACNRDLGGPGIIHGVLTGVISFGPPVCGTPDAPTVFAHLGYYAKWIDSIIGSKPSIKKSTDANVKTPSSLNHSRTLPTQNSHLQDISKATESVASLFQPYQTLRDHISNNMTTKIKRYSKTSEQYSEAFSFLSDLLQKLISTDPVKVNDFFHENKKDSKNENKPLIIINPSKPVDKEKLRQINLEKKALDKYLIEQLKNGFMSVVNDHFNQKFLRNKEKRLEVKNEHVPRTTISPGKYKFANDNFETDVSFELKFDKDLGMKFSGKKHKTNATIKFNNNQGAYDHFLHRYRLAKGDSEKTGDIKETFDKDIETEFYHETTKRMQVGIFNYNPSTVMKEPLIKVIETELIREKPKRIIKINPSTVGYIDAIDTKYLKDLVWFPAQPFYTTTTRQTEIANKIPDDIPYYYDDLQNSIFRSKTAKVENDWKQIYNYDFEPQFVRDDNPFREVVIARNSRSFGNNRRKEIRSRKADNRKFRLVKKVKDDSINFF